MCLTCCSLHGNNWM
uniref:Uncharacterized protein n=1 Tax=Arundo donax TaxID=35708 RepID=A0A0A9B4C9_ARUDO